MDQYIHAMDIEQTLATFNTSAETGLSETEAASRQAQWGRNKLKTARERSTALRVIDRFKNAPVLLLIAAATVTAIINNSLGDTIALAAVLIICMTVEVMQGSRTGKALKEIRNETCLQAKVKREGQTHAIDTSLIVVGDIVMLGKGDIVPADVRIIESTLLKVDESYITGEPEPVGKQANAILENDVPVGDRYNLAYMGSIVTHGRGVGVVYATGINTEVGKSAVIAPAANETATPLQDRLITVARSLGMLFAAVCALTFIIGMLYDIFGIGMERGIPELLVALLALCVAASPKGIADATTVILATGARKMLSFGAIVKTLRTALTLGSATVICTDKTGMLTENKMTITQVADSENVYEVTGVGYKAKGHVVAEIMITRNIALMSEIVVLCNDASYDRDNAAITGDPTEGAMLVFGAKLGHDKKALNAVRPRVREIPFDSERKMMSTCNKDGERVIMYAKGSAAEIIKRSSYVYLDGEIVFMSDAIRAKLTAQSEEFAAKALRVLACAYKVYESESVLDDVEEDLIYVGMMAMTDPPREDIIEAVNRCRSAGISVKMITGDHKNTAIAIAQALGIASKSGEALDEKDLDALTDEQLCEKVKTVNVFAEISPEVKARIIDALKADSSNTVAVTGSGLDDIASLKRADIGIAMGIAGRDCAKDAADIILSDDNFVSIVDAIESGRTVYANVRKAVSYMLAIKIGMLLLFFITVALGLPLPLAAAQLLLANLLTNYYPARALGAERKESWVLSRRPRNPEENIINRKLMGKSIVRGVMLFAGSMCAFLYGMYVAVAPEGTPQSVLATSMCFFTFATAGLLASYPSKTDDTMGGSGAALRNRFLNITVLLSLLILSLVVFLPGLNGLFAIASLAADRITICLVLALLTVLGFEISKLYTKR